MLFVYVIVYLLNCIVEIIEVSEGRIFASLDLQNFPLLSGSF
jgi:hypothetical protein